MKVMEQHHSLGSGLGDKTAGDLVADDIRIAKSGAVTGTLKYVKGWTQFSGDAALQNGHYFPVVLDTKYSGKTITCVGTHTKEAQDLEWVLYVKDTQAQFKFSADEVGDILTLTFTGATLASKS